MKKTVNRPDVPPTPVTHATGGRLDVVATPIGNLGDLSARARRSLEEAHLVAAEDTRHTLILLRAIGLSKPLVSLHEHNETRRLPELLSRLAAGEVIALVSDAGTPVLSDPGFELVRAAATAGYEVRTIPGPSAITAALAVSGIPADRFCFEGFLPPKDAARRARLAQLAREPRTLVFFEAPHRIAATLADMAAAFGGERQAVVAREITKAHETLYRGALGELAQQAATSPHFQRGEITLVVHGAAQDTQEQGSATHETLHKLLSLLVKELPPSKAAAIAVQLTGVKRSTAYELAMRLGE